MRKELPLTCPCALKKPLQATATGYTCAQTDCEHARADGEFTKANNVPVLISETRCDTVCSASFGEVYVDRAASRYAPVKFLLIGGISRVRENCDHFIAQVLKKTSTPKVLVIGSGTAGVGAEALWNHPDIAVHGVDIYASPTVDVVCDAHYLPLESEHYDGVWIQAVLEHAVEPQVVVGEIARVLASDGIVYAETPFMQQVHEGAYDFTRFTVLGHRYLSGDFEAIDFGGLNGPGLVMAWAARYLAWSVFRTRAIGRLVGVAFGVLMRPLVLLESKKSLFDASSAVYFLGRKTDGKRLSHKELVALYDGQFPPVDG
jgi:SAM-dependent methyltransferase